MNWLIFLGILVVLEFDEEAAELNIHLMFPKGILSIIALLVSNTTFPCLAQFLESSIE